MPSTRKKHAPRVPYVSQNQLTIAGFETPFSRNLDKNNRWVRLADRIPWDELAGIYMRRFSIKSTGRPPLNPRIVLGSIIIKHMCNLDDRETVAQISENMYMQYFLGYSSFCSEPPFDPSLFVEFRKRLGDEVIAKMNERIISLSEEKDRKVDDDSSDDNDNKGSVILDATACPQDIAYPTDLNLLSEARQISERLIDTMYNPAKDAKKPRTYRKKARKEYLQTAQKKSPQRKTIRNAVGKQLRYLRRNLKSIDRMLDRRQIFPLEFKEQRYLMVIHTLYQQQLEMYEDETHSVADRIVSLHQPHVRPIVRGKLKAKVEFGSKIHVSLTNGFAYLDTISWDAFNESSAMMDYMEHYRQRFGYYPEKVLADQIYCTRENRRKLKELDIRLIAKPLGRPKAVADHVSPGQRNPIEGKFGQAKNAYGMNRIRARLRDTSQSWIASIIMVLNLVKLAGEAPLCLLSFSACKTLLCEIIEKLLSVHDIQPNLAYSEP
ncbi:MAG: IS5 family transposase [Cyclobacteriaceae bacterium]|nr:IS5 family transposase [Cyclobacteriaceae bacterium]